MSSREPNMRRFTGNVPEEMVTNILLRLDAKTLLGLKLVSKTWLALISSPRFVKSLLEITQKQEDLVHIVHTRSFDGKDGVVGDSVALIDMNTRQLITRLHFPLRNCSSKIVGSACGIVCIHANQFCSERMYLWNPATNLYKVIPNPSFKFRGPDSFHGALGFGFDEIDNDFKIVRLLWLAHNSDIKRFDNNIRDCKEIYVEVYSSEKNAWKKVEQEDKAIDDIFYQDSGSYVFLKGGLLCFGGCYGIITFDLHTGVLNSPAVKYPVPTFEAKINNYMYCDAGATITNFSDSIAVIISKQIGYEHGGRIPIYDHKDYKLSLWALKDKASLHGGGIREPWTLMYNINVNLPLDRVHGYLNNSGNLLLLLYNEAWCSYNPEKEEPGYFTDKFFFGEVFKYTKSLFTIPGFEQVKSNAPHPMFEKYQLARSTSRS